MTLIIKAVLIIFIVAAPDDPDSGIHDTNDYAAFPDFEARIHVRNNQSLSFSDLLGSLNGGPYVRQKAPMQQCCADIIQRHRYQANIVGEKLMLLLEAAVKDSAPKGDVLQLWLQNYINIALRGKHHETPRTKPTRFTEIDIDNRKSVDHLAHLLYLALKTSHDEESWTEHDTELSNLLEKRLDQIAQIHESEPAFQLTLSLLYTSYELVKMVIDASAYISKLSNDVKNQGRFSKEAEKAAKGLLKSIVAKATAVKNALRESGWMDRVLESVAQDHDECQNQTAENESIAEVLLELVGEGFREDWAGNVLESWKDSVIGFSFFRDALA